MAKNKPKLVYSTRSDAQLHSNKPTTRRTSLPPQQQDIRVWLDRKKRKGKVVTVAVGFALTPADLKKLGQKLKKMCGSGGTVKDDTIEIQGDHRDKIVEKLLALNYKAKPAGG